MELRQLRAFLAVLEEGSFTAAAARIYIVQPALSRQVRDLERRLGCELFVRTPRGVEPTEAGTRLAAHARAMLDIEARASRELRREPAAGAPGLRLGMAIDARSRVHPHVASVAGDHRNVIPLGTIVYGPDEDLARMVDEGQLDAAVLWWAEPTRSQDVRLMSHEPLVAVLPAGHELLDLERVTPDQVAATSPIVMFDRELGRRCHAQLSAMFQTASADGSFVGDVPRASYSQQAGMVDLAARHSSATVVTKHNWARTIRAPHMAARPLEGATAPLFLFFNRRSAESAMPLAEAVVAEAAAVSALEAAAAGIAITTDEPSRGEQPGFRLAGSPSTRAQHPAPTTSQRPSRG
jgi:LysR family hca operon transcriptional activator